MPDRRILPAIAAAFLLLCTAAAFAASPVTASGAWIRLLPGDLPLAGYVTLHNRTRHELRVVGATSRDFDHIEMHHSMHMSGMEKMTPVKAVTVPAGSTFQFAPGGYHLMMWRKHDLKIGNQVPVTLQFANGSRTTITFIVKGPTQ
ncbi:MAG TPA: copper chaperone PCu(A)C [Gammaproteobacteria bacterium]|nr:copper chaperone PCu(A)C [Gammaproteobacteria bacterium]